MADDLVYSGRDSLTNEEIAELDPSDRAAPTVGPKAHLGAELAS
jgi:hypothetical protein